MSIETRVKKIIAEKMSDIDIEDIVPEASLIEDLGADSLTIVELVMTFEDTFDIEIDEDKDKAAEILTVQNAIDLVKAKI